MSINVFIKFLMIAGGLVIALGIYSLFGPGYIGIVIILCGILMIAIGKALDYITDISDVNEELLEIIKRNGWDRSEEQKKSNTADAASEPEGDSE